MKLLKPKNKKVASKITLTEEQLQAMVYELLKSSFNVWNQLYPNMSSISLDTYIELVLEYKKNNM